MGAALAIAPARPHELEAAFHLVFRHVADAERADRVANALRLVRQGELDPAGILVASNGNGPAGAIVCLPVPGASGLLWPPQVLDGPGQMAVEDGLLSQASAWLRHAAPAWPSAFCPRPSCPWANPCRGTGSPI